MMSKQEFIKHQLIAFIGGVSVGVLTTAYILLYVIMVTD